MPRSRRKTPIAGITTADSDKLFKQAEHRRERRAVKVRLDAGEELPPPKTFGNPWAGQKDGKAWLVEPVPKLMRK
jgi:hypothetical protein